MTQNNRDDKIKQLKRKNCHKKGTASTQDSADSRSTPMRREGDKRIIGKEVNMNDPSWYASSPALLKDAFSIAIPDRLGLPVQFDYINPNSGGTTATVSYVVPGVMALRLLCIPGISVDSSSAINVAAQKIFTFVRHANSGRTNYEPVDLMMYILAMGSAYNLWQWLRRIHDIMYNYVHRNAYFPDVLLRANMVDPADIRSHLAEFRVLINTLATKLNTLCVPDNLHVFDRQNYLFGNVFIDDTDPKAQAYVFVPFGFHKYVEVTEAGQPNYLEFVPLGDTLLTFADIQNLVNAILNPLYVSADFATMSGDIVKAYGIERTVQVPITLDMEQLVFVKDMEALSQIENCSVMWATDSESGSASITQNSSGLSSYLVCSPNFYRSAFDKYAPSHYLLNFHWKDQAGKQLGDSSYTVTPEEVAIATRLAAVFRKETNPANYDQLYTCGTEVVVQAQIYSLGRSPITFSTTRVIPGDSVTLSEIESLCALSQFDYAPIARIVYDNADPSALDKYIIHGDLDNYTQIHVETLKAQDRKSVV